MGGAGFITSVPLVDSGIRLRNLSVTALLELKKEMLPLFSFWGLLLIKKCQLSGHRAREGERESLQNALLYLTGIILGNMTSFTGRFVEEGIAVLLPALFN